MPAESEWISAAESSRLYKRGGKWLQQNRVPMKSDESGLVMYERARIEELVDEARAAAGDVPEGQVTSGVAESVKALADAVKAVDGLIRQVQGHHERLFGQYDLANKGIYTTLREHLEHQNAHVLNLEKHQLEFRIVMESALSQQHERAIASQESERRGRIQEQAAKQIGQVLLPWLGPFIGKKLGVDAPAAPAAPDPSASTEAARVGQFAIQLLSAITDEQFDGMKRSLGPEVSGPLDMLRQSILKGEISA